MSKPGDRRPQPSRRDVARIAAPGSLIIVYDDLVVLVIAWSYKSRLDSFGTEREPAHYCEALLFDPRNRERRTSSDERDRVHTLHWTTVSGWLFDSDYDLVSEVISASDPER